MCVYIHYICVLYAGSIYTLYTCICIICICILHVWNIYIIHYIYTLYTLFSTLYVYIGSKVADYFLARGMSNAYFFVPACFTSLGLYMCIFILYVYMSDCIY